MSEIRFEQASFILKEQDKIKIYEQRYWECLRLFQKNPFLQFRKWDLYSKILEYSEPVSEHDFSKYLFKKLDECFTEVEELQKDKELESLKTGILEMIQKCNKLGIL